GAPPWRRQPAARRPTASGARLRPPQRWRRIRMASHVRTILAATAAALAVAGCGGDGIPRVPVAGRVTLDGQPLQQGQITFMPDEGENVAAGAVTSGSFKIPRSEGPSPGPHRVMIWSKVPTGNQIVADPMNPQDG